MFGTTISKSEYFAMKSQYESKAKELANAEAYVSRLNSELSEHKSTIETMAAKYSFEIEELRQKISKTENSVNAKVNCALASIGVSNFAVETIYPDNVATPDAALKKFTALSGAAKTEYYNDNKALITRALESKQIQS